MMRQQHHYLFLLLCLTSLCMAELDWRGVDVSYLPLVEEGGAQFRDNQGVVTPLPRLLADNGINVARITLWHTPTEGCCDLEQALELSQRLDDVGIDIVLDYHFSDTW